MTKALRLAALLIAAALHDSAAQDLPFRVSIVGWQRELFVRQAAGYRGEPADNEELYCIESWKTVPGDERMDQVVIDSVRHVLRYFQPHRGYRDAVPGLKRRVSADVSHAHGRQLPVLGAI